MAKEYTGIIGGSGLYELEGFEVSERRKVETPFGPPSDELVLGELEGRPLAFLPRHGRGHVVCPSNLPYKANIYALKTVGVTRIISVSAVGSMKEEIVPGHVVLVDQFIDRTVSRPRSFFEDGIVGHVGFGDPVSEPLRQVLVKAAASVEGLTSHDGGTYICIEGPQFSTRAESNLFRSWGVSVIGMTNLPEARLAREAEIDYATVALSTDYDCWHTEHDAVTVDAVIETLKKNVENAKKILRAAVLEIPGETPSWPARNALTNAIMTAPDKIPAKTREALAPILARALG